MKRRCALIADDALNIVYVEYEMPGPNRMPFSAAPDKEGYLWIPDFGPSNRIGRLDPKDRARLKEFMVPNKGTASVHSAVPAPDGSVWAAEQASNKARRKWDPKTHDKLPNIKTPMPQGCRAWKMAAPSTLSASIPRAASGVRR